MDHAISTLQTAIGAAQCSEQVFTKYGETVKANLMRQRAESLIEGLSALQCIQAGHLKQPETFEGKIAAAINCHSLENGSDTPDFILAEYLKRCLGVFDSVMVMRTMYYDPRPTDGEVPAEPTYRMLEEGEVLLNTDEFNYEVNGWQASHEAGHKVTNAGHYRRKIVA